jgi:hypothetical protein
MDDRRDFSALLGSNPLFQDLHPDELNELARRMRPAAYVAEPFGAQQILSHELGA